MRTSISLKPIYSCGGSDGGGNGSSNSVTYTSDRYGNITVHSITGTRNTGTVVGGGQAANENANPDIGGK